MTTSLLRPALVGITAALAAWLTGCAAPSSSPQQDARFGEAAHRLFTQQRLNPDASRQNEATALGADGRTVRASGERLLETYRTPRGTEFQITGGSVTHTDGTR